MPGSSSSKHTRDSRPSLIVGKWDSLVCTSDEEADDGGKENDDAEHEEDYCGSYWGASIAEELERDGDEADSGDHLDDEIGFAKDDDDEDTQTKEEGNTKRGKGAKEKAQDQLRHDDEKETQLERMSWFVL